MNNQFHQCVKQAEEIENLWDAGVQDTELVKCVQMMENQEEIAKLWDTEITNSQLVCGVEQMEKHSPYCPIVADISSDEGQPNFSLDYTLGTGEKLSPPVVHHDKPGCRDPPPPPAPGCASLSTTSSQCQKQIFQSSCVSRIIRAVEEKNVCSADSMQDPMGSEYV